MNNGGGLMSNNTKVLIGGSVYTLSGSESEEYLQRVALYINKKMEEVNESAEGKKLSTRLQNVLLAINLVDDLFKAKEELKLCQADQTKLLEEKEQLMKENARLKEEITEYTEIFNEQ